MSATLSPTRPIRSPTPVLNEDDAELQAFLAAAKREAQEKWEKLRATKASGVVEKAITEGEEVVSVEVNVKKDIDDVVGGEEEVVLKVEPKPCKVVAKMIAGMPRSHEMIPVIPVLKKQRIEPMVAESSHKKRKVVQSPVVVDTDSDSIPVPFPRPCEQCVRGDQVCRPQPNAPNAVACDRCHIARQSCSFLRKSKKTRVRSPPSESDREEKRELRHAIEELTVQVRALVCQGQRGRESRGDRKGKGKRREFTPETDHYSSE